MIAGLLKLEVGLGRSDEALQEEIPEEEEGLIGMAREGRRVTPPQFPSSLEADELCLEREAGLALFAIKGEGDDGVKGVGGELVGRPSYASLPAVSIRG